MADDKSSGDALYQRFLHRLDGVIPEQAELLIGYSGGLDSTVLLDLLFRARASGRFHLRALHVHHGLSPYADAWALHCEREASARGIPLDVKRVAVRSDGNGIEAAARALRYQAFSEVANQIVVLAHHTGDQAETLLYRLIRGTGVRGAACMAHWVCRGNQSFWRPLLNENKASLLAYARSHDLKWIEDESNQNSDFDRNFLRLEVLPLLSSRFPSVIRSFERAAQQFSEAAEILDEVAASDAGDISNGLNLHSLTLLSASRQRNVLRWFLGRYHLAPSQAQMKVLQDQQLHAATDTSPVLRLGNREIRRYRAHLFVVERQGHPLPVRLEFFRDVPWNPPGWQGLLEWNQSANGISESMLDSISIISRLPGMSMRTHSGGPRKALKQLFQEAGIPPWLREHWPIFAHDGQVVAVPGIGIEPSFQAQAPETGWIPVWQSGLFSVSARDDYCPGG